MKNIKLIAVLIALTLAAALQASEFHVAVTGSDVNPGTKTAPFRTIQRGAELAQPGDTVTVHAGIYRERVSPPRGGSSDRKRIVYQTEKGAKVQIIGSERVKGWEKVQDDTWKVTVPNSFFGSFNPYSDLIHGDWFHGCGRQHHTGAVYLNGDWLVEAAKLDDLLKPVGGEPLWFGQVDKDSTVIFAQFKGVNPNASDVEINVRQTVFTPEKTGIDYITVRGFDMRNAAPPWAPPTAKQIGIVSALWCKGWIIEDNEISYSSCSGVALGKYGDEWDNRAESAEGYVGTLSRALTNGWNKATVGSHLVRRNHIHHCEQTGVVGSLGCSFSMVEGNEIHDIHVRSLFNGAEMGGIKFHGAIDVTIRHNHIYRCGDSSGIWLDWMAQGAQVTGNLLHDNTGRFGDLFLEMQHGPLLVANNILISKCMSFALNSQGVAVVHNLIVGPIDNMLSDNRATPYHKPHSTELAGTHIDSSKNASGDHRFYNNLFVAPCDLRALDQSALPCFAAGNVFTQGSQPSKWEKTPLCKPDFDPALKFLKKADGYYLEIKMNPAWRTEQTRGLVTSEVLGNAIVPGVRFENHDGSSLKTDTDYFGKSRNKENPTPGPFENFGSDNLSFKVW